MTRRNMIPNYIVTDSTVPSHLLYSEDRDLTVDLVRVNQQKTQANLAQPRPETRERMPKTSADDPFHPD
ncbi:hypothetical protein CHU98_g1245 [Xylaria longipes]|nr:hypothetical protein CHU98_g1245 [Xylaria longipes]